MLLPELVTFESFGGNWQRYEDAIYQIFLDDIVRSDLSFLGCKITCQFRPATKNKHFGFWHLISEGEKEAERFPDLKRCERIRWIAYVIKNAQDKDLVKCWENKRGGNTHIVLWLYDYDYVVILARRSNYLLLRTAYVIAHESRKKKFLREMEQFVDPR